jgi:hypothetical protein
MFNNRISFFSFALVAFFMAIAPVSGNLGLTQKLPETSIYGTAKTPSTPSTLRNKSLREFLGKSYNYPTSESVIAQSTGWIGSIFGQRPRKRNISRNISGICPVAPGLFETYLVWHDRPLFLWQSTGNNREAQLIVRDEVTKKELWKQTVNIADQKFLYSGKKSLEPGKGYQWQLSGSTSWATFEVMKASDRQKIQADLQTLEQQLKVSKASEEEIALRKADYFVNYKIKQKTEVDAFSAWSDALQALYTVEKPSATFVKQRDALVVDLCKRDSTSSVK